MIDKREIIGCYWCKKRKGLKCTTGTRFVSGITGDVKNLVYIRATGENESYGNECPDFERGKPDMEKVKVTFT